MIKKDFTNILLLCTGNSCRSPMAEGWLKTWNNSIYVISAGIFPEKKVNRFAVEVMLEKAIDISQHNPRHFSEVAHFNPDLIITLSQAAKDFITKNNDAASQTIHIFVDDPMDAGGTDDVIREIYRSTRDELEIKLKLALNKLIKLKP